MALMNCPDCETECSDMAPACPKCGRPLGNQKSVLKSVLKKELGVDGIIYALILIIFGIALTFQRHVIGCIIGWIAVGTGALLLFARLKIWWQE
jgi:hypothetical protein